MPLGAFQPPKPAPRGSDTVFRWGRKQELPAFCWRREKNVNLIRTINPEFKDFSQIWGWKITTVHEKMYR
jgi:hypothetical protein